MKKKILSKKLKLGKQTIVDLKNDEMNGLAGGAQARRTGFCVPTATACSACATQCVACMSTVLTCP